MTSLNEQLSKLSAAEEFLDFFGIAYDEKVVRVNRLHILKRFHQYLQREARGAWANGEPTHDRYRALLQRAYDDFVASNAAREKVFKVFQDAQASHFPIEKLHRTPPARG